MLNLQGLLCMIRAMWAEVSRVPRASQTASRSTDPTRPITNGPRTLTLAPSAPLTPGHSSLFFAPSCSCLIRSGRTSGGSPRTVRRSAHAPWLGTCWSRFSTWVRAAQRSAWNRGTTCVQHSHTNGAWLLRMRMHCQSDVSRASGDFSRLDEVGQILPIVCLRP